MLTLLLSGWTHDRCSINMNIFLYSVFGFAVTLSYVSGSDIYPSINWDPQNSLFVADGVTCGQGPRRLKVQLQSKVYFICPNIATVLQTTSVQVQTSNMYENLWIVYNKTVFDNCDTSLEGETRTSRLLLQCNTPTKLNYFSLLFPEFAAHENALLFEAGKTYYFIATSDGTESHINDTSGGHCAGSINNIYMKIEVYVCEKSNLTYQDPDCRTGVGEVKCPRISTETSSSIVTHTSTAQTTLPSTTVAETKAVCPQSVITYTTTVSSEVTSTTPPSTTAAKIKAVCPQSVITYTKTVSSEVTPTNMVSCADVINVTLSNSAPATGISTLATTSFTQTISSTQSVSSTPNPTIQVSQMIGSEETGPTALIPPNNRILTTEISTPKHSKSFMERISSSKTVSLTQTVGNTFTPSETIQISPSETASSEFISSTTLPVAVTSTKSVQCVVISATTVFSAFTSTEPCTRCRSVSSESIKFFRANGQRANLAQLSDNKNASCKEGTWMAFGIIFLILFAILFLLFFVMCIVYRKKIFSKYSSKVSPHETRNGVGLNAMGFVSRENPEYPHNDVT